MSPPAAPLDPETLRAAARTVSRVIGRLSRTDQEVGGSDICALMKVEQVLEALAAAREAPADLREAALKKTRRIINDWLDNGERVTPLPERIVRTLMPLLAAGNAAARAQGVEAAAKEVEQFLRIIETSPHRLGKEALLLKDVRDAIRALSTKPAHPDKPVAPKRIKSDVQRKGGLARAASLTPSQRSEIARKAAAKRWANAHE